MVGSFGNAPLHEDREGTTTANGIQINPTTALKFGSGEMDKRKPSEVLHHKKGHIIQEDHYYPFGMNINALSSSAALSKPNKFKHNGKEEQTEFDINWYDYGARMYDPQIGRWNHTDPLAEAAYDWTPYRYAFNNPISYLDPDGLWEVRMGENGLEFIAEADDNLETFSTQTGIDIETLQEQYGDLKIEEGGVYGFGNLKVVSSANDYLNSENIDETNCSNCALAINGIQQIPAWGDNDTYGVDQMIETQNILDQQFENVPESNSSAGDIVTFNMTEEHMRTGIAREMWPKYGKYGKNVPEEEYQRQIAGATERPSHYAVVLLKTKDGKKVKTVLEKSGTLSPRVRVLSNTSNTIFTPAPKKGDNHITYKKKGN